MCRSCVKQNLPNRESTCLDTGAYLVNFAGCTVCDKKGSLGVVQRIVEESEDGEELVTYQHVCEACKHVVANHEYRFSVTDDFQEYSMVCLLCGRGEDTRSVMPVDPRQQPMYF